MQIFLNAVSMKTAYISQSLWHNTVPCAVSVLLRVQLA